MLSFEKDTIILTQEQLAVVEAAKNGNNIICDAIWGAGKTTLLIQLNEELADTNKKILYLTYNRELKEEARKRFKNTHNNIHNYDAFASMVLRQNNLPTTYHDSDTIVQPERLKLIPKYDVLLVDEYQDINRNHSLIIQQLLVKNPDLQIIIVGDRDQKIADKSSINALEFFKNLFLQSKRECKELTLTHSFRLNSTLAKFESNIYNKPVVGDNTSLVIEFYSDNNKIIDELANYEPGQILILGGNYGEAKILQNMLEQKYPSKFNKTTLYSSISDKDTDTRINRRHDNIGLDITFDTCKGLEKDIVVLCDFSESYWQARTSHTDYGIIKNLFNVALTRAKKKLIIKESSDILSPTSLKTITYKSDNKKNIAVNDVIRFKPANLITDAFNCLDIVKICDKEEEIKINKQDGLIDTSFILGEYIEANYFKNYSVDKKIELFNSTHQDYTIKVKKTASILTKLKALAAGTTCQNRYYNANISISNVKQQAINRRIAEEFDPDFKNIELNCSHYFKDLDINVCGIQDAVKNNIVYELKFVSQLTNEDFLQCAIYMFMTGRDLGVLWNLQNNIKYKVVIKNLTHFEKAFKALLTYTGDTIKADTSTVKLPKTLKAYLKTKQINTTSVARADNSAVTNYFTNFAVIDVETAFNNRDILSIGLVISDSNFKVLDKKYYLNKYVNNGIYNGIKNNRKANLSGTYEAIILDIKKTLKKYNVDNIFAYNASFDKKCLFELNNYIWRDIMSVTKNKLFNEAYATKTEKGNYRYTAESIYRQLYCDNNYVEKHVAITDAEDELLIMQKLNINLKQYSIL